MQNSQVLFQLLLTSIFQKYSSSSIGVFYRTNITGTLLEFQKLPKSLKTAFFKMNRKFAILDWTCASDLFFVIYSLNIWSNTKRFWLIGF